MKEALRSETKAIVKGCKWTKSLLKSVKKGGSRKSIVFLQETLEKEGGFRGLRSTKKVNQEGKILPSKWKEAKKKIHSRIPQSW